MAFGFGFNKAKVLSAAEKAVQQGKLQHAISEYEKIIKEDPKDLTVLNTVGDLCARVGQTDRAATYFRKVGDAYASDGFTVKAIAMYKKLSKLNPSAMECIVKLAELYTQQGLYNDARTQYVQLAEHHMRAGDTGEAARIFQKMLELDPENIAMQSKLADLYVRLDRKDEARDILFRTTESLCARGSLDAADKSLARILALEPTNGRALLMRGQIALDSGNGAAAVEHLEKIPDIDSRPDGLRSLLRGYLQTAQLEHADPIARKLLSVHNDLAGIRMYAEALTAAGNCEEALRVYDEHAQRLLAADPAGLLEALQATIGKVKTSPSALTLIRELYQKAGDTAHMGEVNELLAHALVQAGELQQARDLYRQLSEAEPDNPLHAQNYRQILARLGEDSVSRPLSQEQGAQAFMADELEFTAPPLCQEYPQNVADAVKTALTDSELFDSYNLPAKAIPPLEAVLPTAPFDARINQRLASLYGRAERYADAARCCVILERLYSEAGYTEQGRQYRDMAAKYAERAGLPAPPPTPEISAAELGTPMPEPPAEPAAAAETEFQIARAEAAAAFVPESVVPPLEPVAPPVPEPVPPPVPEPVVERAPIPPAEPAVPEPVAEAHEIDLSDEWESALVVEPPAPPTEEVPAPAVSNVAAEAPAPPVAELQPAEAPVADLIEEMRFYISQGMGEEARAAIAHCRAVAPDTPELQDLEQELERAVSPPKPVAKVEVAQEVSPIPSSEVRAGEFVFDDSVFAPPAVPAPAQTKPAEVPLEVLAESPATAPETARESVAAAAAEEIPLSFSEPVSAPPTPEPVAPVKADSVPLVMPEVPAPSPPDTVGELAMDLEESLGEDFAIVPPPPLAEPVAAAPPPPPPPMSIAVPAVPAQPAVAAPLAAAAAASAAAAPAIEETEAGSSLADIFAEFKEDVEEQAGHNGDPETHYNLGVAFKEMGLLDEAIGELQKVCQAIDRGSSFPHVMQAYTWLAQCFLEKGVPEAGIRWYEKALKLSAEDDTRMALHYELACALEAAGERRSALSHFMEVYGVNIDYRDVAARIQALKS